MDGCAGGADTAQSPAAADVVVARSVASLAMTSRPRRQVETACAAASKQHLTVSLYCPRLVPAGPIGHVTGISDDELFGAIVISRDLYQLSFNNGSIRGRQHWIVGGGRPATVLREVIRGINNEQAHAATFLGTRRLAGHTVALYRFPDPGGGLHAGHIGAFARRGPMTIFASLHGYSHADAAVAMTVALLTITPQKR